MPAEALQEPWKGFLHGLDDLLTGPTELHCFGGFVLAEVYGLTRPTADIDIFEVRGSTKLTTLRELAGKGSVLAGKYRIYLDLVTIAEVPEDYVDRLVAVFLNEFRHLRLRAFERHDLALAKLVRNADHDRDDVKRLATGPGLDTTLLRNRYRDEMRPRLGRPDREDLTLDLWVEMIEELQQR